MAAPVPCDERVIIVGVVDRDRRAGFVGDARRARPVEDDDLVFRLGDFDRGERGRRRSDIHQRIDVLGIEPFPRGRRGNIRLVLMIRGNDFDRLAEHRAAEILHRHLRGRHRADAGDVCVDARHVLDHADFHHAVGDLFLGPRGEFATRPAQRGSRDRRSISSSSPPECRLSAEQDFLLLVRGVPGLPLHVAAKLKLSDRANDWPQL